MADLKPVGSEKLPLDLKIQRIIEIANYREKPKVDTHNTASLEYNITARNGSRYGIIRENSKYMILKEGEKGFTYLDGMKNNSKYSFNSYSEALKKLNLIMKPINEAYGGKQFNLIGEQEELGKKYVLKQPEGEVEDEEESFDFSDDTMTDDGGDTEEVSFDDTDMEIGAEGGEEIEGSMEVEVTDDEDATKAVQKLTGKLGQKLRDLPEADMNADIIKYVLNSIIAAINLDKLTEEDKEEIVEKFEDEDVEYTEEGEFDVELGGEEELDLGSEDFDFDDEEEIDLETELGENWGSLGKMALGAAAAGFGERAADKYLPEESEIDYEDNDWLVVSKDAQDTLDNDLDEQSSQILPGENDFLEKILNKTKDDSGLAEKVIDSIMECGEITNKKLLDKVFERLGVRGKHCGKMMNVVQDERCTPDLIKFLTGDGFKGMSCLMGKFSDDLMKKGKDIMTGMLDEEGTIHAPSNPELSDEAAEAVADVFDMFESDSKVGKTLTSYFNYTKEEKRKIRESKDRKSSNLHLAKNNLLESVIRKAKNNRRIKTSYSTYEQERSTSKFLKENKNFKFVGKSKKGSLIFKGKNKLVEINTRGRIS